jgi:predicted metal-dependent hydrolase
MCAQDNYDPHYLGYFECFNRQRFFEAHEVLEALWLPQREGPNGSFYKGLIQLAGAFVHWQKNRPGPAAALFKLARANLQKYPATHEGLSVEHVLVMTDQWLGQLTTSPPTGSLPAPSRAPQLQLEAPAYRNDRREGGE